jgi:hypothetical protein
VTIFTYPHLIAFPLVFALLILLAHVFDKRRRDIYGRGK